MNLRGTWLLERYAHRRADGSLRLPLGEDARGLLIHTSDCCMSGRIMRPERPRFQGRAPAAAEIRAALLDYTACFGAYTVNGLAVLRCADGPRNRAPLDRRSPAYRGFHRRGYLN